MKFMKTKKINLIKSLRICMDEKGFTGKGQAVELGEHLGVHRQRAYTLMQSVSMNTSTLEYIATSFGYTASEYLDLPNKGK